MTALTELETILRNALIPSPARKDIVTRFIRTIGSCADEGAEWEILRDLAWDLSYYEPDPRARAEDPSYYGEERLTTEIEEALHKLECLRRGGQQT
jgi:hypothetical protein